MTSSLSLDPGSFRDPQSRVLTGSGEIYRALSAEGAADFDVLERSGLLADRRVIGTERLSDVDVPADLLATGASALLRHERVPFISYPYEWTFSMLKDAAILQLDLLLDSLEHGLVLKDASPYNVQFCGARPVFIDVGSFERLNAGELWVGYRQFCMLCLYPLLLTALKNVRFQPWLRGSIDGISASEMRGLLSVRDRFRRGLLLNVFLHARLETRASGDHDRVSREIGRAGAARLISANARKMRRLVARLDWQPAKGVWTTYGDTNSYDATDAYAKDEFVRSVAALRTRDLVWDLGCNNGRHARIAARHARCVVAMDSDHGVVDLLYRDLRGAADKTIVPLTVNLADPSPGIGWRGAERQPLLDRGRPQLVLALALVHHLVIGANVPLKDVVDWLSEIGGELIVEFPTREDPMVQGMLASKREGLHQDYDRARFEAHLGRSFEVKRSQTLSSGTRVMYHAVPLS